jgi:hypothetical protein
MLFALVACSSTARAENADGPLARAKRLMREKLQFSKAIDLLTDALDRSAIEGEDRVEAYALLAFAYVAKDAPRDAEQAFESLLLLDPEYALDPMLSPAIQKTFEEAKSANTRVRPKLEAVRAIEAGDAIEVHAHIDDPRSIVKTVVVFWKSPGRPEYASSPMSVEGPNASAMLQIASAANDLAYHLAAMNAIGRVVARAGDESAPLTLKRTNDRRPAALSPPLVESTSPEAGTSVFEKWWFWVAVGIVAAGGATATVLIVRHGHDSGPPPGSLGVVKIGG